MNDLITWFDDVTHSVSDLDPDAFANVDIAEARKQLAQLTTLVTQVAADPFTVRDNRGGSGQSDSS